MVVSLQGDASTPAMPSMSGTNTASSYSDTQKHPSLSGKGKSSSLHDSNSKGSAQQQGSSHTSHDSQDTQRTGSNNMDRGNQAAVESSKKRKDSENATNSQGSDNMGGGSSAIYSQGPRQEEDSQKGAESEGDASTPAMPSMSGTGTASSYSDKAKNPSLSGRDPSGKSAGLDRNPTDSHQESCDGCSNPN